MRTLAILILNLSLVLNSCEIKHEKKFSTAKPDCVKGEMKSCWYESSIDGTTPPIKGLESSFTIWVDTNCKARNFISEYEDFYRKESQKALADSVHTINNQGQIQVWIINNTADTVYLQMQDGSYICILQALDRDNQWRPIQYWRFSTCGNSYYSKDFPPEAANSFITTVPHGGNYETRLRFKLLATNRFYYSNEFSGKINYCEFIEDSSNYNQRGIQPKPHYKLDSLVHLYLPDIRQIHPNKKADTNSIGL